MIASHQTLTFGTKILWNLHRNLSRKYYLEMAAILSRLQCVNASRAEQDHWILENYIHKWCVLFLQQYSLQLNFFGDYDIILSLLSTLVLHGTLSIRSHTSYIFTVESGIKSINIESALFQIIDRCLQATSHYPGNCYPIFLSPYNYGAMRECDVIASDHSECLVIKL